MVSSFYIGLFLKIRYPSAGPGFFWLERSLSWSYFGLFPFLFYLMPFTIFITRGIASP